MLVAKGRKGNGYLVSGNVAYKEDITREPRQLKRRPKVYNKRWKPLLLVLLSVVICCFIIMRYAQATSINHEIYMLKKELSQLERENELLNIDLMCKKDLSYIEEYAKEKLGMDYPTNEQIVCIKVPKNDDNGTDDEVVLVKSAKQDQGILSILAKFLD